MTPDRGNPGSERRSENIYPVPDMLLTHCWSLLVMLTEVKDGRIEVRRGIERFTEDGVVFAGETASTPVDVVIFATGFRQAVDFIDPEVVQKQLSGPVLYCFPLF